MNPIKLKLFLFLFKWAQQNKDVWSDESWSSILTYPRQYIKVSSQLHTPTTLFLGTDTLALKL
jgi:hypothetical protein